jgi:hypothetical protein
MCCISEIIQSQSEVRILYSVKPVIEVIVGFNCYEMNKFIENWSICQGFESTLLIVRT